MSAIRENPESQFVVRGNLVGTRARHLRNARAGGFALASVQTLAEGFGNLPATTASVHQDGNNPKKYHRQRSAPHGQLDDSRAYATRRRRTCRLRRCRCRYRRRYRCRRQVKRRRIRVLPADLQGIRHNPIRKRASTMCANRALVVDAGDDPDLRRC